MVRRLSRNPQGRPAVRAARNIREAILDASLRLFARQGVAATSIAAIGEEAGVTAAMVHYYFDNKEGLLEHVAGERIGPCLRYIWLTATEEEFASPKLMVEGMVDRLLEVVSRMPAFPDIWSREIFNAGGLLRPMVLRQIPSEAVARIVAVLARWRDEGKINAGVSPELLPISIMGVVMLPLAGRGILRRVVKENDLKAPVLRGHALSLLLAGLCPGEP